MPDITMKQLLEAGVHFGHQRRRWNPKMAQYIYTERNGIFIIDLKRRSGSLMTHAPRFAKLSHVGRASCSSVQKSKVVILLKRRHGTVVCTG